MEVHGQLITRRIIHITFKRIRKEFILFFQVFSAFDCMLEQGLCSVWFGMRGFLYDPLSAFRITKNICF